MFADNDGMVTKSNSEYCNIKKKLPILVLAAWI